MCEHIVVSGFLPGHLVNKIKSEAVKTVNYTEAVEYINEIPKFTTKNKFEHTKEMMRRLGNPEAHMKIIHVAGTNGKGSVCASCKDQ